ncbi:MAG: hypothetical protein HZA00_01850 [Nitrospinae bacterium]|nr:hypothetical protein [Nitrospinota bacterium]
MHIELEKFKTGWYEIFIGIQEDEIDTLIENLRLLKTNKDQHFHISSDYEGEGGIGEIEFYVQEEDEESNMKITGLSISPNR